MKISIYTILTFILVFTIPELKASTKDTMSLDEYLALFDAEFKKEFNFGWTFYTDTNLLQLTSDEDRLTYNKVIKLDNGITIEPKMSGYAHSYRKVNYQFYQFITHTEGGEAGSSLFLYTLDLKNNKISDLYQLANAFGDQGDWSYKYGRFINDSTYNYLHVYGTLEQTIDSVSGIDRIRLNGEVIELKKTKKATNRTYKSAH